MNARENPLQAAVASPCVGVCALDSASVCIGCGRSIGEIAEWSRASEARRQLIVASARQRQAARPPAPDAAGAG